MRCQSIQKVSTYNLLAGDVEVNREDRRIAVETLIHNIQVSKIRSCNAISSRSYDPKCKGILDLLIAISPFLYPKRCFSHFS